MRLLIFLLTILIISCNNKEKADLLIYNAHIYTIDSAFSSVEAMAVKDDKILATGTKAQLEDRYSFTKSEDAAGKFIYPGLIDAHAHFVGYGMGLLSVDLVGTESWSEIIDKVKAYGIANAGKDWIIGRGWDQNDWQTKEFPTNKELNALFPDRPVMLQRVDGHAAIANDYALQLANITANQKINGGEIMMNAGRLSGVLVDNAVDLVTEKIPAPGKAQFIKAMMMAERNCLAEGLTTIDDCGLNADNVESLMKLQEGDSLQLRMYVMLSDVPSNYSYLEKRGKIKTDQMNVRSFKVYGDGALGSRGACLLQPYHDKPGYHGFLLSSIAHFDSVASWIAAHDFQMCTHAIGDSGNRTMLNIYAKHLKEGNNDRWRIEHAQVVDPADINMFGRYSIIPSVQPTHATSDMYWAADRLGNERIKHAYVYQDLLKQSGWLPLGTDFPVEDISPLKTFYAAVARKDAKGWPQNGFQNENALTREQALRGMTIWAAKANFEEFEKGSLEQGKFADFIIMDTDLMKCDEKQILNAKVLTTYIGGKQVFKSK